nr:MAG TPA: hypothetical protein [Caudoviricetes sp.]
MMIFMIWSLSQNEQAHLSGLLVSPLLPLPLRPVGVIQSKDSCLELFRVDLQRLHSQIDIDVIQAQGKRRSGHACIFPTAGDDGVGVEYLRAYAINIRLRYCRQP